MIRRLLVMGAIFFCFPSGIALLSTDCLSAEPSPKSAAGKKAPASVNPSKPSESAVPAAGAELNAAIEKVFVKNDRIFIRIARSGAGTLAPEEYPRIVLRLETSKGLQKWTLAEVDKARSLARLDGGKIEFDTGIALEKGETVKAILSLGKIEKVRKEALHVALAPAGTAKRVQTVKTGPATAKATRPTASGVATLKPVGVVKTDATRPTGGGAATIKPVGAMKASIARPTTKLATPVPMIIDRGIRITAPVAGGRYVPGTTINVSFRFGESLTPSALQGVVLLREATEVARVPDGELPAPTREMNLPLSIPAAATTGDYYSVMVTAAGGVTGQSDVFHVGPASAVVVDVSHGVRVTVEGNPLALACDAAHPIRVELVDPAASSLGVPSLYYSGGSRAESLWLHQSSVGSMGYWTSLGWVAGSLVLADDYRSMSGRAVIPCVPEGNDYVLTFNHAPGIYGNSPPFIVGVQTVSVTVVEPGSGGEHFATGQERNVRWEYHPPLGATTGPSDWRVEFHRFDIATGATSLAFELLPAAPVVEEIMRGTSRVFGYRTTWNTSSVEPGTYKVRVLGGGADDWGSLAFSVGAAGSYDLSIAGIEWDGHQLVADVRNPDRITGAIDFLVSKGAESWRVPTVFPSSDTAVSIGLGAPGPLASSDRFSGGECRPMYSVTIDASNRVDERDETNNTHSSNIGWDSMIRFTTVRWDASENLIEGTLTASPPAIDWDHHANGHLGLFTLYIVNCGSRTVEGTVTILQEGCFPGPGAGGALCEEDDRETLEVVSSALSIGSYRSAATGFSQGDVRHVGSTILIRFSGDLATFAPANPVRFFLNE